MVLTIQSQRPYTADDLLQAPDDGHRYEVIGGELIVSSLPSSRHQRVSRNLLVLLESELRRRASGEVFAAPFDVHLSDYDVLQPDLVVILAEHRDRIHEGGVFGPPDLVIEIASPSNAEIDRVRKAATYANFGVPEYWIVDPELQTVVVLLLDGSRYRATKPTGGRHRSSVIPGLDIDEGDVFRVPQWMET